MLKLVLILNICCRSDKSDDEITIDPKIKATIKNIVLSRNKNSKIYSKRFGQT
ncbi:hypothetical protein rpr22_CDSx343 [Rickettsia prowazekii str. Rp22]|uniref:Uncharacterized protein n=1 Tax=Rickettsia prowazekii (strain Rp22) TaxID=449216 RepID=D5AWQ3_RICPP|nr:hypothetical protein rpr22_CDSx343 [Rickettsia prowazekii str. Rp22]